MMKNTMMICLALFAAFGCTGQSKAGKGKTQELTTMENQKEIYLAGGLCSAYHICAEDAGT